MTEAFSVSEKTGIVPLRLRAALLLCVGAVAFLAAAAGCASREEARHRAVIKLHLGQFKTDLRRRCVSLLDLRPGGFPKDGMPAIDRPRFVSVTRAAEWMEPREPVIALSRHGSARAYPLRLMLWRPVVNDIVGQEPVVVTFCPIAGAARAFRRSVEGQLHSFAVAGLLRNANMIIYDRADETLWQQLTGRALVGASLGLRLDPVPLQVISLAQFAASYPTALVVSPEPGDEHAYGRNPYPGYDDVRRAPQLYRGRLGRLTPPLRRVVGVELGGRARAYSHANTRKMRVVQDEFDGQRLVIFHADGALSPLDDAQTALSRDIGSTGVFTPAARGRRLTFRYQDGAFVDDQTNSRWDVTGRAVKGALAGTRLRQVESAECFSFAWFAFHPKSDLYLKPQLQP